MRHYLIALATTFFLFNIGSAPTTGVLEIKINNIEHHYGTLWIGVYPTKSSFLKEDLVILYSVKAPSGYRESVVIHDLEYGEYAIALFHDLNDNGTMDVNWLGIPSEPYAFSKPIGSKWRVPEFEEVKVSLNESQKIVNTSLTTWWDQ